MRFDDKLDTVFAHPTDDSVGIAAVWMQIVDILAQDKGQISASQRQDSLHRLAKWKHKVPIERRQSSARSLVGRRIPADLVSFFGSDVPQVSSPLIATVQLDEDDWNSVISSLPSPSRAILRERRDLPNSAKQNLLAYGSSDFALPAGTVSMVAADTPPEHDATSMQIKDLVARIEAFKRDRESQPSKPIEVEDETPETGANEFRFETNTDGIIYWVDGVDRGPVIGIDIAKMAEVGAHGVDGHAAGAFRRRTAFKNARLVVPGDGRSSGDWIISGLPCFNPQDGRFFGYRGTARRFDRNERPMTPQIGLFGASLPADSLRQLVHELRTPLNAIRGFAEMINAQLLGPVSIEYCEKAESITDEATKLLALFDDLDVAAKLERGTTDARSGPTTDVGSLLHALAESFVSLTNKRHIHLRMATNANLPPVAVDPVTVERMFTRMLAAIIGLASAGETISAQTTEEKNSVVFTIDRPKSLIGQDERNLLDPAYGPEGEWPDAPALGLGFALRLVANIAKSVQAQLQINPKNFSLVLPIHEGNADSSSEQV